MAAATYVGRVGALAVALGVGSAIFAGQGVAWADEGTSPSAKPAASATAQKDTSDGKDSTDGKDSDTGSATDDADSPAAEDADDDAAAEDAAGAADDADPEDDGADPEDEGAEPADDPDTETDPEADPEPVVADDPAPRSSAKPTDTRPRATGTTAAPAAEPDAPTPVDDTSGGHNGTVDTAAPTATTTAGDGSDDDAAADTEDVQASQQEAATVTVAAATVTVAGQDQAVAKKPNLITAVVNVVNSMLDWAKQKAAAQPGDAPQPPFLWALMAFARRELDTLFAARTTNSPRDASSPSTSLAVSEAANAAAAPTPSYSPWLNPQVSESTRFISWVTGARVYPGDSLLANTLGRFGVYGTDVGTMWDNGMVDDPSTPWNENQILIAVGDTFGAAGMSGRHLYNTLFRSGDTDLSDGMTIPDGEWFNGNMFGGAPLESPTQARPIINRPWWAPGSVTLIPTAGVSVPTEVTEETPFGTIQYVNFMSVTRWGSSGRWTTNYSATAYSTDNGENFTVAPESVRYNSFLSGNRNFQQSAYVKGDDGYVYVYGTPNGRQGAAYLARVKQDDILDVSKYEYYKKASSGWFGSSPARWVAGSPSSASAIIGKSGGLFGFLKPGYTVSEMSVQYNEYLQKYIVLYGDQANRIVMRTSDTPEGGWSDAIVLMNQQPGGIYAPMAHPWSPSTLGTGSDLYWNLSLWSEYNIMLMKTDLTKI
ncbi:hypothetical protein MPRF_21690 [Mycolicibacterium parafortuitum]|uniref:DUF4185 domain-containing protein n=1 Tax=Mycolicibacterium parafortuitum TaxID=39692 RepID=A0A7I7U1M5_MYCPF|nr:DUF4185 domain-containing protein [Mycolicibacterium parafortuitum]BBY75270.1 hypothetical protein MPRF_21690 [Mycolicibacterium parafortuitum]